MNARARARWTRMVILRRLRITGPRGVPYCIGDPMLVHDGKVLICTLDPVPVSPLGNEIHIEHFSPPWSGLEDARHLSRLVFLEICAFVAESFDQIQAVSFAFSRPLSLLVGASQDTADRAEIMHRIGIDNVRVAPMPSATPGHFVVTGVWVYSERNLAALNEVVNELRNLYQHRPIGSDPEGGAGVVRRLLVRWRSRSRSP